MYSTWFFLLSAALSFGGVKLLRELLIPLGIIFLLIPLPNVLGPILTSECGHLYGYAGLFFWLLFR